MNIESGCVSSTEWDPNRDMNRERGEGWRYRTEKEASYCTGQHTLDYWYVCIYCESSRIPLEKNSTSLYAPRDSAYNYVEFLFSGALQPEKYSKTCARITSIHS